MAVNEAGSENSFVNTMIKSIPDDALANGVYSEEDLLCRFYKVYKLHPINIEWFARVKIFRWKTYADEPRWLMKMAELCCSISFPICSQFLRSIWFVHRVRWTQPMMFNRSGRLRFLVVLRISFKLGIMKMRSSTIINSLKSEFSVFNSLQKYSVDLHSFNNVVE